MNVPSTKSQCWISWQPFPQLSVPEMTNNRLDSSLTLPWMEISSVCAFRRDIVSNLSVCLQSIIIMACGLVSQGSGVYQGFSSYERCHMLLICHNRWSNRIDISLSRFNHNFMDASKVWCKCWVKILDSLVCYELLNLLEYSPMPLRVP